VRNRAKKPSTTIVMPNVGRPGSGKPAKMAEKLTFEKFSGSKLKQEEYLKWLELGATLAGAAKKVGCSRLLIREYCKVNEDFFQKAEEARMRGFHHMTRDVEQSLYKSAKAGNMIAILTWLYNREPSVWRDMRSLTLKSVDDVIKLLPPGLAKALRPFLAGDVRGN